MSIYETVATIDDLNRKMQGREPRSLLDSPFGKYGSGSDEAMAEVFETLHKKKPKKPGKPR